MLSAYTRVGLARRRWDPHTEPVTCNGCGRCATRLRRGLCDPCYVLLLATGERVHMQVRGIPGRRFLLKVDMSGPVPEHAPQLGPCWLWTGAVDGDGYGIFRAGPDEVVPAHVWVFRHTRGRDPLPGMHVDHLCHHPGFCRGGLDDLHRLCTSPLHVAEATPAENNLRSNSPTAVNAAKQVCLNGHPLAGDNLYVHPKRGTRHCRQCQADRARRAATAQSAAAAAARKPAAAALRASQVRTGTADARRSAGMRPSGVDLTAAAGGPPTSSATLW
jgi:hypothetical protein